MNDVRYYQTSSKYDKFPKLYTSENGGSEVMGIRILILSLLLISPFILINPAAGEDSEQAPPEIGIVEKLGDFIPDGLYFQNEKGDTVELKSLIEKPTVLSLVYYGCPGICQALLSGVAEVLDLVNAEPGKEYNVITVSFDPKDAPEASVQTKKDYLHAMTNSFPEQSWTFLTGEESTIQRLTNAVGYYFKKDEEDFIHPTALIVFSPEGKIVRYLYGISYQPFDLEMALSEASEGRVGATITRVLRFCYSYDPEGKRYAINVTRVAGTGIIAAAIAFLLFLTARGRRRKRKAAS
jgi:protein SCO1/2